ncbi:MAG: hypothetical protein WBA23_16220 [Tunicatimonas sp.]
MADALRFSQDMIDRALTKVVVNWFNAHPQHGPKWTSWSLDTERDRKRNNPWPAIHRYVPEIVRREAGNYRTILVIEKATDQIKIKIDHQGEWHYY